MNKRKLILKILYLLGITMLFVGCSQVGVPQEAAEISEVNPTETSVPPSPTETSTTEPTQGFTEEDFIEADLLGTWALETILDVMMSFEANGILQFVEGEQVVVASYKLNGDVVTFTNRNCYKIEGGQIYEFRCSADYKVTFLRDNNNHAYLTFELIGEDEYSYRRGILTIDSPWVKVE